MRPLEILDKKNCVAETNRKLSEYLDEHFRPDSNGNCVDILEAGCGTQWNLTLSADYKLTCVDLSQDAIEIRRKRYGDIDEFIVADLAEVEIENNTFDLVYCSWVLEHLRDAEAVLDRFLQWIKPGGLVVLIFPDRNSVFGFITRLTPQWFHLFYYKYIGKFPHAGEPGYGPFTTYYHPVVSRRGIHKYCRERGCTITLEFATPILIPHSAGALKPVIATVISLVAAVSLGRLTKDYQNLALIIKKPRDANCD